MAKRNRQKEADSVPAASAEVSSRMLGILWFVLLAIGIVIATWQAWRQTGFVEEFAQALDSFGYQQMAEDIRTGSARGNRQRFTASSPKAEALIADLRRQNIPLAEWEAMIGPQAYHVKILPETTDGAGVKIVNQYPPGVPRLLALFPQGKALGTLYAITCIALALIGGLGLGLMLQRWLRRENVLLLGAAGAWAVTVNLALMMLGTTVSYSVDFSTVLLVGLPPLLLAVHQKNGKWVWPVLAVAGAIAGYAILMRVTSILLMPGWIAFCFYTATRLGHRLLRMSIFAVAAFLTGPLPLMLHQKALTGDYFTSTYGARDITPPSFDYFAPHISYYFAGDGSLGNWTLWMALVAVAAAVIVVKTSGWIDAQRSLWGGLVAAGLTYCVPAFYFLTHKVTTPYYALPALLATITMCAAAIYATAKTADGEAPARSGLPLKIAVILMLIPGLAHVLVACMPSTLTRSADVADHNLVLPAELHEPNVWIFADRFSGTLWFYHGLHAQSFLEATPRAREAMYRFAFSRGEKQYVILDLPAKEPPLKPALEEILALGGTFRQVGKVDGQWIAEIVWPPTGPLEKR